MARGIPNDGTRNKSWIQKGGKKEDHPNWKGGFNQKKYNLDYARNLRNSVIEIMGAKCVRCGFDDKRALQIDHINSDGRKERGISKIIFHRKVISSFLKKENRYQLLCANCNWIKRYENNEQPGRKGMTN